MPHVATSPQDLIETIRPAAHLDGDRLVIDDERPFRDTAIRDLAWTAAFSTDDATTEAAQWLVWEASQELGARSASIQELYAARGRGEVSGFTVPAINLRAQTFDMARTVFDAAQSADVGAVILEIARSEQTYTFQRPIDFATSVLAGAIAADWRAPVFIQGDHYQFNAKKYAADPEAMTEEIRRACRLAVDAGYRNIDIDSLDARRPVEADRRRAAARELRPRGRADRAHPVARDRRRDDQRRWRDRRGRPQELDGRGAARLPRWVPRRARRRWRRARRASPRSASRPGRATVACHCPAAASPRSSSTSRCCASSARSPARTGWPARSSTAPRPCPTSCSTASRRSRRPRSTSRPASRTRCTSTRRSPPSSTTRSRRGCSRTPPTSASPSRPTSSSCTRPARRPSGRSSASCGTWRRRTRSSPPSAASSRSCSRSWASTGRARWSTAYIRPVEVHRPMPESLREAAAAGLGSAR